METRFSVRTISPGEWRVYRDLRLQALRDSPNAFGSTLEWETGRSDSEWARRLEEGSDDRWNLPLVVRSWGEPAGLAWGRIEMSSPEVAHLYQLWVSPGHRGQGLGKMLLDAVVGWAREVRAARVELGVTRGDTPAFRLYSRAGFNTTGDPRPIREGSHLLAQTMVLEL